MFDLGFPELMVVVIVAVLVVGPRELPRVLRTVTGALKKIRGLASEFQSSMEEMAREADLDDIKKDIKSVQSGDWTRKLEDDVDPTGELQKSMKNFETDIKDAYNDPANQAPGNSIKPPVEEGKTPESEEDWEIVPRLDTEDRDIADANQAAPKVTKPAKKAAVKKTAAKKAAGKKAAGKTAAKKTAGKKAGSKKSAAKKAAT